LAFAGYIGIVFPGQQRLRAIAFRSHELYDLTNRNQRMAAHAPELRRAASRVRVDLERLAARNGTGATALAAVTLLERETSAHNVTLLGFAPAAGTHATDDSGETDLTITLRGAYRDLLKVIAALSGRNVLLELLDTHLSAAAEDGSFGVEATIHARLYHSAAAILSTGGKGANSAATTLH